MPSIDSALHNLLGPSSTSADKFAPSLLRAQRIEFVDPTHKDSYMDQLRAKYSPINRIEKPSLPQQPRISSDLYCRDRIDVKWRQKRSIGCGLVNPANTCYLNSTLQCLLYTPPLINYLLSDHKKHCRSQGFCVSCGLLQLYNAVHSSSGGACRPSSFIHHLKLIAKHFCFGRQEDAHEFLVHLRDKMIQQFLHSHPKADSSKKDTTPAHAVFGGKLVSTVTCSQCSYQSHTNECFLGLGLDVRHSETIQQSFNKLCKKETLCGPNSYKCEKCKRTVIATKQFKIDETPNVLVLHLKRFQFGGFIGKLKNQIRFPENLDINTWSRNKSGGTKYALYAVLVHAGSSAQCGHYYCFVKSQSGSWHCMNDTSVSTCSLQRVLNSEAYLLFYVRNEDKCQTVGQPSSSNGTTTTNGTTHSNGQTNMPGIRLMDSNPFFPSEKSKLTSKPVKFSLSNSSKLIKNPYLKSTHVPNNGTTKSNFIGPLLPNGHGSSKPAQSNGHSNGISKKQSSQNGTSKTSSSDKSPDQVISCTTSLSSLDIIKSAYPDDSDSDSGVHKPNAQPVLTVRKKNKSDSERKCSAPLASTASERKTSSEKEKSSLNVFERLGQKAPVKSWNGTNSKNFVGSSWQSAAGGNKRERDEYDEELDQGRCKKVKHAKQNQQVRDKHCFQKAHEFNKNQKRWEDRKSWSRSPKHFWKNKKHKV